MRKNVHGDELLPVLAQDGELTVVSVDGQPVVTARALARALEYKNERAVTTIYYRHKDSFKDTDVMVLNLSTIQGMRETVAFTKRGALKVCMKSNQPRAVQVQEMLLDLYEAVESQRMVPVEAMQEYGRKLDELAMEVRRLVESQESRIVYLPKVSKPRATDLEAVEFFRELFAGNPRRTMSSAIRELEDEAGKRGWKLGSRSSLYRLARRVH